MLRFLFQQAQCLSKLGRGDQLKLPFLDDFPADYHPSHERSAYSTHVVRAEALEGILSGYRLTRGLDASHQALVEIWVVLDHPSLEIRLVIGRLPNTNAPDGLLAKNRKNCGRGSK
jgi:hypothetical protein